MDKKYQVRKVDDGQGYYFLVCEVREDGSYRRVEGRGKAEYDKKANAQKKARTLNADHAVYMEGRS